MRPMIHPGDMPKVGGISLASSTPSRPLVFKGTNGTYTNKNTGKKYKVDSVTGNVTEEFGGEEPLEEGYSFTIGELFDKSAINTDCAGNVSTANFLTLVRAQSLDELNDYYDENGSLMKFNTDNSLVLNLSSWEDTVNSGEYALGFMYMSEEDVFLIILFDSDGDLESTISSDKAKIDAFADTYASVKITLKPLGE